MARATLRSPFGLSAPFGLSLSKPLALAFGLAFLASAHAAPLKLHVPSPDWRDQVIYFVVTDRFDDGDPRNNDQGFGEHKPGTDGFWQGGDFAGLLRRLDYIRGLGATALWVTPPVANRAFAPALGYSGYHGYWAEHFKEVDAHLGTLADYRRLSDGLHRRGMYLVQDIVVNHTADYFHYAAGWDAADPDRATRHYAQNPDTRGTSAPRQWPFSLNDPRVPAHRAAGIYHWTPDVSNYTDPVQERTYQMSGLDDLNTDSPLVRRALRESHGWWIRAVGVDALRVDTAFYVPPAFYADFLRAKDPKAPGVLHVARATGRRDLHVFGEGFGIDKPGEDKQARKINSYMRGPAGDPLMPGMLNFPLYGSLNAVFARGAPTAELADRIERTLGVHRDPWRMPTFVDNHDVDRFLSAGREPGLKQALLALMTLPGIPVIYYGTEQGFTKQRAAMFAAGVDSGGRDRFDEAHPLYRFIAAAAKLRRGHRVLSRGTPRFVASDAAGPGAVVWVMEEGAGASRLAVRGAARGERLLVAINTAEHPVLVDNAALGAPPGAALEPLFAIDGAAPKGLVADAEGRANLLLPAQGGLVWRIGTAVERARPAAAKATATALRIAALPAAPVSGDFELAGSAAPGAPLAVVVDGRWHEAQRVVAASDGQWRARVDTASMIDPAVEHRVVALAEGEGEGSARHTIVSPARTFRVQREWRLAADLEDPAGDDRGPGGSTGSYRYPTDPGWGENRQADIRRVRVFTAGGAMRIEVRTNKITTGWNPANGFDRVAFSIFIELPGQPEGSGARMLPLQRAAVPDGMRWHRRIRAHGWSNALFDAGGANEQNDGTPLQPAARIEAAGGDVAANTVRFTLPSAALGRLSSLAGAKVYVTTWDYDAGYRKLQREASGYVFGGASGETDPLVMDDALVTLR